MRPASFWARTVHDFAEATAAVAGDQIGGGDGWLHRLDPRAKVIAFLILAAAAASLRAIFPLAVLLAASVALAAAARVPLPFLVRRAWGPAMVLAILLAVPLAVLPPGSGPGSAHGWSFGPTEESVLLAASLVLRVLAATTFCCVLLVSTSWSTFLKAMRLLGAPAVLVSVVSLSFRYVVYFFRTAQEMFEAAESRRIGRLSGAEYRRHLAAQVGVLTGKTATMSEEVYLAMVSRGYRGEVRVIDHFAMTVRDWIAIGFAILFAAVLFLVSR